MRRREYQKINYFGRDERLLMKKIILLVFTVLPGGGYYFAFASASATFTGAKACKACKNCKYCKHCAKDGGKCGVCK